MLQVVKGKLRVMKIWHVGNESAHIVKPSNRQGSIVKAVVRRFSVKACSKKFLEIHRKIPVPKSVF